jgi:hypothetical protein
MPGRLIDNYLHEVEVRRTVRNWPEDIKAIVDGYRAYTTISHSVQKDAIQNGSSVRKDGELLIFIYRSIKKEMDHVEI